MFQRRLAWRMRGMTARITVATGDNDVKANGVGVMGVANSGVERRNVNEEWRGGRQSRSLLCGDERQCLAVGAINETEVCRETVSGMTIRERRANGWHRRSTDKYANNQPHGRKMA